MALSSKELWPVAYDLQAQEPGGAKSGVLDREYEDDATREMAGGQGFTPVVPPKNNRRVHGKEDKELYKRRNKVERLFR